MQSSTGLQSIDKGRNGESIGECKATLESSFVSYASGAGSALGQALASVAQRICAGHRATHTPHAPAIERSYQRVAVFRLRANREKKSRTRSRVTSVVRGHMAFGRSSSLRLSMAIESKGPRRGNALCVVSYVVSTLRDDLRESVKCTSCLQFLIGFCGPDRSDARDSRDGRREIPRDPQYNSTALGCVRNCDPAARCTRHASSR